MGRSKDNYKLLRQFFDTSREEQIRMTFEEIERIIGTSLPPSAYKYSSCWSNSQSNTSPLTRTWLEAGYVSQHVNLNQRSITFRKATPITMQNEKGKDTGKGSSSFMSAEHAVELIWSYYNGTIQDPHGRYLSWWHCYNAFCQNRNTTDRQTLDYLSLQLAFYLASWGMMRGSSFLLQKDYKVHIPIVEVLQEEQYRPLYAISAPNLCKIDNLDLLDDVSERIRKCYEAELPSFEGRTNQASDTLVTKILLGTFGCVPAFDTNYVTSVKRNNISSGKYNRKSVENIARFYSRNMDTFEALRMRLSECGMPYPPMKLMDMCFWQDSYLLEEEKKMKKQAE